MNYSRFNVKILSSRSLSILSISSTTSFCPSRIKTLRTVLKNHFLRKLLNFVVIMDKSTVIFSFSISLFLFSIPLRRVTKDKSLSTKSPTIYIDNLSHPAYCLYNVYTYNELSKTVQKFFQVSIQIIYRHNNNLII